MIVGSMTIKTQESISTASGLPEWGAKVADDGSGGQTSSVGRCEVWRLCAESRIERWLCPRREESRCAARYAEAATSIAGAGLAAITTFDGQHS